MASTGEAMKHGRGEGGERGNEASVVYSDLSTEGRGGSWSRQTSSMGAQDGRGRVGQACDGSMFEPRRNCSTSEAPNLQNVTAAFESKWCLPPFVPLNTEDGILVIEIAYPVGELIILDLISGWLKFS